MEPRPFVISSGAKRSREISFANSFLWARNSMEPRRIGNPSRTVSCGQETPWSHALLSFRAEQSGVEKSPGEQFPVDKQHHGAKPNRKPFANSFLWARNAMESRRTGNPSRTVSCGQATPWSQGGQETIGEQFPVGKKRHGAKADRKL
jgi:hypothetical protein